VTPAVECCLDLAPALFPDVNLRTREAEQHRRDRGQFLSRSAYQGSIARILAGIDLRTRSTRPFLAAQDRRSLAGEPDLAGRLTVGVSSIDLGASPSSHEMME